MARIRSNYTPWQTTADGFSNRLSSADKLTYFARYGVLAPSGHNTQPWQLRFVGDKLHIEPSKSRALPDSGDIAGEPYVSLGTFSETLRLAGRGFGYTVHLRTTESGITASLGDRCQAEPMLLDAITNRVSNRNFYDNEPLPTELVTALTASDFTDALAIPITDRTDIDFLANQTLLATSVVMSEQLFRTELSRWVRNNVTRQHDGMPGFVQGMPTPPSLIARHIVKNIDISKGQAKTDSARVAHSPLIVLLCAHPGSATASIHVGQLYARIAIQARLNGIDSSGIGAAVFEPTSKQQIAQQLNLTLPPAALLRLGHAAKSARHTPRWPIEQLFV